MATRTFHLASAGFEEAVVADIAPALAAGAVAAYPTETFYGLGALSTSAAAVERVFRLKGRDASRPLPLIASDTAMVRAYAGALPEPFERLAAAFWPGPLTLVLPAGPRAPEAVLGPGRTLGIRVSPLGWLARLVGTLGAPLTATSANRSGEPPIDAPDEVLRAFVGWVDLLIDGGRTPGGKPSTILDVTGPRPRLLRDGAVSVEALRRALPEMEG